MSADRIELPLVLRVTEDEYCRIAEGLIPQGMEDKWSIFLEGQTLWFHRSWAGECVYKVDLEKKPQVWSVKTAWLSGDVLSPRIDNQQLAYQTSVLRYLIERLLLGKQVKFPLRPGPVGEQQMLEEHYQVGWSRPNRAPDD
jgi:hypothetical protein